MWDEGERKVQLGPVPPAGALHLLARRRVRGVPDPVVRALLHWAVGQRRVELLFHIPSAEEVLEKQTHGLRCVSLLEDGVAKAHGDPRHPDGLAFALHDLCHLEKFVAPEHHAGQVGFFFAVARALASQSVRALEDTFDDVWRADRDYVISDMNGSAIFLFAALKMKLSMAIRRRLALEENRPPPRSGALVDAERVALAPALALWLEAMALPATLRRAAVVVSARRDSPGDARLLLDHFEAEGARRLAAG